MIRIRGHPAQAEQNQRFQAADILIRFPKAAHIIIVKPTAGGGAFRAACVQILLCLMDFADHSLDRSGVKIHICDSGEQALQKERRKARGIFLLNGPRQSDEGPGELILKHGRLRGFSADSRISGAACAAGRLFTLKTKHISHTFAPFPQIIPEFFRQLRSSQPATG